MVRKINNEEPTYHAPLSPIGLYETIQDIAKQVENINDKVNKITEHLIIPAEIKDMNDKT